MIVADRKKINQGPWYSNINKAQKRDADLFIYLFFL